MKRIRKIRDKVLLHPIMAFLILTAFIILLSGILDLFDVSVTYNKLNTNTGNYEATLVTVESLLNLGGIKYIFSNTVSNFASFTPLIMLLISLIGIGIMDRSGLLDTLFFILTKNVSKTTVTFVLSLICMILSLTGDLSFVVMIPLSALLFKYGKRNPSVGIIHSFAALSLGYSVNIFLNSVDSSLLDITAGVASKVSSGYEISSWCFLFIMIVVLLIGSFILTYVTEKITAPKLGKYIASEEEVIVDKEKLTRKEKRGLLFAAIGAIIYLLIIIYNIIPNVPFGGNFLDDSGYRYIDKLFGPSSFFNSGFVFVVIILFFITGLLYGIGTKTIENHRDICNYLSHSLDGIGKPIVLLFFASTFISLLKYTKIGLIITALFANMFDSIDFTGIPLILVLVLISMITTILSPALVGRWEILSASVVPKMMAAGYTAELSQLIFSASSSLTYGITPAMAYFVIYISFLEKYGKDDVGLTKSTMYLIPYVLLFAVMWLLLFIIWPLVGLPIGIGSGSVL